MRIYSSASDKILNSFPAQPSFSKAIFQLSMSFGGYYYRYLISRWPGSWLPNQHLTCELIAVYRSLYLQGCAFPCSVTSLATAINRAPERSCVVWHSQLWQSKIHDFLVGFIILDQWKIYLWQWSVSSLQAAQQGTRWCEGRHEHLAGGSSSC